VRLPDVAAAQTSTPEDLAALIDGAPCDSISVEDSASALRAAINTQKLHLEAEDESVFATQTLNEVAALSSLARRGARALGHHGRRLKRARRTLPHVCGIVCRSASGAQENWQGSVFHRAAAFR